MKPVRLARWGVLAGTCVALCFSAAPAIARKKQQDLAPATTGLIDNINGLAVGEGGRIERFSGLLIDRDGRIERRLTGGEKAPERLAWRMDGKGRTLIPSFVDSHARVIDAGIALMTLDLSDTRSLAEAQAKIATYARENEGRKWILGGGWDSARWAKTSGAPERTPTAADLDASEAAIPVWLLSADGEAGWANSAAMKLAGIAPSKGATGVFTGAAKEQIEHIVPPPAPKDRDIAFDKAQRLFLTQGISMVADMGTTIDDWQAYRRAGDRGALRLRISGYADGIANMVTIAGPAPSPWLYDDRLRLGGVHFALDGTLATRTAWLKAPYADAPGERGAPRIDATRLRNQMSRAAMDGFQIALSAHGDAAGDEAIAAIAEMAATYGGDRRWRIEGADVATDFRTAGSATFSGIMFTVEPDALRQGWAGAQRRIGETRMLWPWSGIGGGRLALGGGPGLLPASPFVVIATAMSRTDTQDQPLGGLAPATERLGFEAAFAAATTGGASALFAEQRIGALRPGQWADFLLIDRDISIAPPRDIAATAVLEHWIDGKRVWAKGEN